MGTINNLAVGYSGALYVADLGTTFPTDPTTAWGTGWADLGFISPDGVSLSADMDVKDFDAWGFRGAPVLSHVTKEEFQFQVTLIESNAYTLSLWEGVPLADITSTAAVTGPPAIPQFLTITKGVSDQPDIRAFGIDVVTSNGKLIRHQIPRGQVIDRGEIAYKDDELTAYQLTIKALLSSSNVAKQTFVSDVALPA